MFNKSKSRRLTAAIRLRRSGLAALLISLGSVSAVTADEQTPNRTPQQARLQALPPLPTTIQQLQSGRASSPKISTPATLVRSNPFAIPSSGPTVRTVGGIVLIPIVATDPKADHAGQPASIGNRASAMMASVNPHITPTPLETHRPARLLHTTKPVVTLRRLDNDGRVQAVNPQADAQLDVSVPQPAASSWVVPLPTTTPAPPAQPGGEAITSSPNDASERFETVVADSVEERSTTSFSLSDYEEPAAVEATGDETDQIVILEGSAELLQVGRPQLLTVAEPLMLDGDAATQALHGDVRSSNIPRSLREIGSPAYAAVPIELAEEMDMGVQPEEVAEAMAVELSEGPAVARGAFPLPQPMDLEEVEQSPTAVTNQFAVDLPEPIEPEPIEPEPIEPSNLPVPQVYRPKQSLVIDVPVAKPSPVETVSSDESVVASEQDSLFQGKISEVLSISVAQSYAHVPSEAVRRVQLEDRDICEAVLVGAHKLLLIGRREGSARLAIWCGEAVEPTLYEIQVGTGTQATPGSSLEAIATRLTETIAATYPGCRVRVVPQGEGLAVVGQATDARSARDILRLVRSACLKTVNDQLVVR